MVIIRVSSHITSGNLPGTVFAKNRYLGGRVSCALFVGTFVVYIVIPNIGIVKRKMKKFRDLFFPNHGKEHFYDFLTAFEGSIAGERRNLERGKHSIRNRKNQQKYWEDKDSAPDGKTLAKLCEYFGVTSDYLLGIDTLKEKAMTILDNPALTLTADEKWFIEKLRRLDKEGRTMVESTLIAETRRVEATKGESANAG